MENRLHIIKKRLKRGLIHDALPCLILALFLFVFALTVDQWKVYQADRRTVQAVLYPVFGVLGAGYAVLGILAAKKKIPIRILIYYTMFLGLLIRLVYICYTSVYDRQYDVWYIHKPGDKNNYFLDNGHMMYIYNLYDKGMLPVTNKYQFYHPPLWHISAAAVLRLFTALGYSLDYALECVQVLGVFCSEAAVFIFYRMLTDLKLGDRYILIAMLIGAFCPILVIMGGTINNDVMMCMFFMATMLFLVRWWRFGKTSDIIKMGVTLGLGMMTKTSCVLIAPVIAAAFIIRFAQSVARKIYSKRTIGEMVGQMHTDGRQIRSVKAYIRQFILFGCVSVPLGIWYQVRNLILFDQSFTYVMRFKRTSTLYCGETRFLRRLFSFPPEELTTKLFCSSPKDYSIFPYLIKTSVFEEHGYEVNALAYICGWILFYTAMILAIVSTACMVINLVSNVCVYGRGRLSFGKCGSSKESVSGSGLERNTSLANCMKGYKWIFAFIWGMLFFSYLSFCLKYPFSCSMDARYIVPTIFICLTFMMMMTERLSQRRPAPGKMMMTVLFILGMLYAVCTVIFYVGVK